MTDHQPEFAAALSVFRQHVHEIGYTAEETTLLMIGFAEGWRSLDQGLQRLVTALKIEPEEL